MYSPITFVHEGIELKGVAAGPEDGPVVVLLHGFPEFWYCWHKQIPALASAGFRVIVPDQRGYNQSSKPASVEEYRLKKLTSDVIAIADQVGRDQICLAGHDWGAAVAWNVAAQYPHRVARLAILNVPHPAAMLRAPRRHPAQLLKSWYMFFFQLPGVPEWLLSRNNFEMLRSSLIGTSNPGTFNEGDVERYLEAWRQPGALTGMINWYRALFRYRREVSAEKVRVPVRILWGKRDRFLVADLAQESSAYCTHAELVFFDESSHWVQHEEPERISAHLIEWFVPGSGASVAV